MEIVSRDACCSFNRSFSVRSERWVRCTTQTAPWSRASIYGVIITMLCTSGISRHFVGWQDPQDEAIAGGKMTCLPTTVDLTTRRRYIKSRERATELLLLHPHQHLPDSHLDFQSSHSLFTFSLRLSPTFLLQRSANPSQHTCIFKMQYSFNSIALAAFSVLTVVSANPVSLAGRDGGFGTHSSPLNSQPSGNPIVLPPPNCSHFP